MPVFICVLLLWFIRIFVALRRWYKAKHPDRTFFGQLCFDYGLDIAAATIKEMLDAGLLTDDDLLRVYLLK
jgi:hypothetical protein